MKFSRNSLDSILSCFSKNKIQITFDEKENIIKALNQVIQTSARIYFEENKKNLFRYKTIEYNITKKYQISSKVWYSYGLADLLAGDKLIKQMGDIQTYFNIQVGLFEVRECYALVFTKSNQVSDCFLYATTSGNLDACSEDYFVHLIQELNLPNFLNEIRNHDVNRFWISYVGTDYQDILNHICFRLDPHKLLESSFFEYYKNYDQINDIHDFILSNFSKNDMGMVGFDMRDNSVYLEIFPDKFDVFFENIKNYVVIDYEYINSLNILKYENYTFKFIWNRDGKLNLSISKIYENLQYGGEG